MLSGLVVVSEGTLTKVRYLQAAKPNSILPNYLHTGLHTQMHIHTYIHTHRHMRSHSLILHSLRLSFCCSFSLRFVYFFFVSSLSLSSPRLCYKLKAFALHQEHCKRPVRPVEKSDSALAPSPGCLRQCHQPAAATWRVSMRKSVLTPGP